jgi:hypothetical protein
MRASEVRPLPDESRRMREGLDGAIASKSWAEVPRRSSMLIQAMEKSVMTPDPGSERSAMDGIFKFGTIRYERAPAEARDSIVRVNETIDMLVAITKNRGKRKGAKSR